MPFEMRPPNPWGDVGNLGEDEEMRKRRLAGATPFDAGLAAPSAVAGVGSLAASGLPGGLWGPAADYSGKAGSPRDLAPPTFASPPDAGGIFNLAPTAKLPAQQNAEAMNDMRDNPPGPAPAMGPREQWSPNVYSPAGLTQFNFQKGDTGWDNGNPNFTPMDKLPGAMPRGSNGVDPSDPLQRVRQIMLDAQANTPNMGAREADALRGAQLQAFEQAQQGQTLRDVEKMRSEGRIQEAELKQKHENSPEAYAREQAKIAAAGAAGRGATDEAASAAADLRYRQAYREAQQRNGIGSPLAGAVAAAGTPSGAASPPTDEDLRRRANTGSLDVIDRFLGSQAEQLPKVFTAGGGHDAKGKPITGYAGKLDKFTTENAGNLLTALSSAQMTDKEKTDTLSRLLTSPAGEEVRKSLLSQAAVDELANYNPQKNAPRMPGGLFSRMADLVRPTDINGPSGQMPGSLTLEGTPFTFKSKEHTVLGQGARNLGNAFERRGNPYEEATLDTGESLPIEMANAYSGVNNPLSDTQKTLDERRKQRLALYKNFYGLLPGAK